MKAAFITALAALATSVVAAPTKITSTVDSVTSALPLNLDSVTDKVTSAASGGHVVQDLGPEVRDVLEVTGPNAERLLIQLSPEVAGLLSSLGLPALGGPVGSIVASASSVGELVKGLGPHTENLLTVVGEGGQYLLIQLSGGLSGLLSGLGLPAVGTPVGSIVATLGNNLKRDEIVQDLAPQVQDILEVTGPNAERLLLQLSPEAAALVSGLSLPIGAPVGEVVASASSVGELPKDLGKPVHDLITVVGADGSALLVKLAPSVASLVSGLGLAGVGQSVGSIVATLGNNL
ncbi:hypothetical protein BJX68DRAFT_232477 [Aspergillus pseudodeflectus]|uniref:Uncharacterized protein n=1 Tax=Aspergillus pseudodeflectus TaxID=176178 RepID=A0ABR4KR44_9EURO